tara:strand:- start:785 stop:2038 length:1254 start_codon:yes stop_codon:yes gene_type:complete
MANSLTKVEQIAWEEACEAFENNNIFAQNSEIYKPNAGYAEQAGQTIRIPYANQIESSTGLSVSGAYKDIIDVSVPISLAAGDIKNSSFTVTAIEGNFERRIKDSVNAAVRKLSSDVSKDISDTIIAKGALIGAETTALTSYSHFAKADAMLDETEANASDRYMYLDPRMAMGLANDLGMRQTDNSRDHDAYSKSQLPDVGAFQVHKTGSLGQVTASSVTSVTVNGANQDVDPVAYNSDAAASAPNSDDIRTQSLILSASTYVTGDVFTIAGVNRVGRDTKVDTGQLQTFRVIAGGATTITISPAIVAAGPYQNVTAKPANSAACTIINTDTVTPAVFTTKDAVTLFASDLNMSLLEGSARIILDTYTTSSGLSIAFLREGEITGLTVNHRLTTWCKPNVVDPSRCGLLLPSQNAAI